jgi:berberine-like enzyme
MLVRGVTPDTVASIVAAAGATSGSTLLSVEFRQLGGALERWEPGDGAAWFGGSDYAVFAVGIAATPEMREATARDVKRALVSLREWDSGRDYMNFREGRTDGERLFSKLAYERLLAVKRRVDPDDVIRSNHPLR